MLGNDQDCYGGCTDGTQAYYGLMDEVHCHRNSCITRRLSLQGKGRTYIPIGESDVCLLYIESELPSGAVVEDGTVTS